MSVLLFFSIVSANWPDSACAEQPSQSDMCLAFCSWKDCGYDHWCSCGSCLPMSYCMTACTFITCSSGNCCSCGYCYSTSSTNVSLANESVTTSPMFSGNYSAGCGKSCNISNGFCYQDQCYVSNECEGKCDNVQDCDTCFCGVCLDDDDDVDNGETVLHAIGYQAVDSPKKPDTFLACLVLAAVALIGVIGLLVIRFHKPSYKQFGSSMDQTAVCVETNEIEVQTQDEKSDIFF